MTGSASGRQLECTYQTWYFALWPFHKYCGSDQADYSARFESEKHSFSITGSAAQKSEINTFYIQNSAQVDFIPLDVLSEFPNLNGIAITGSNLPTLKSGLFREEFNKIEFLDLKSNQVEVIEAGAFQYLVKLKWIRLGDNKLQTLSYWLFVNNPDLTFIGLWGNKIASIHPNFFDGLLNLKFIVFEKNLCIDVRIGCETCSVSQADLKNHLGKCFANCSNGTFCQTSYQILELMNPQNDEVSLKLGESLERVHRNGRKNVEGTESELLKISNDLSSLADSLTSKIENSYELGTKATKEAIETNNRNMQECCSANGKAVEKLKESMTEINSCTAVNQVETKNESAQLFEAQMENMRLKMDNLELKCARKEEALGAELKALKQEVDGKKDTKSQLEVLKQKINKFVDEKIKALEKNLTTGA
jgi:hypothetical protein